MPFSPQNLIDVRYRFPFLNFDSYLKNRCSIPGLHSYNKEMLINFKIEVETQTQNLSFQKPIENWSCG